jgi:hypothetical protein
MPRFDTDGRIGCEKLTADRLRELLNYNPDTGEFSWKVSLSNAAIAGSKPASSEGKYVFIRIDNKLYPAHRLAWLYMTGRFPCLLVDHKNGIKNDNKFSNLREANKSENGQNQVRARSDNKTGFLGVYPYGSSWRACIRLNGKTIYLGTFDTPEIAHAAYIEEKRRIHPACTI